MAEVYQKVTIDTVCASGLHINGTDLDCCIYIYIYIYIYISIYIYI